MSKYAVITGASSGIGKSFAALLAKEGYDLVLIARRRDRLEKIAGILEKRYGTGAKVIAADLASEDETKKCYESIKDLDIEIFINNAGFGEVGSFLQTDVEKELLMVDVNVKAVLLFSKLMVNYFREKDEGYLLNVASSAGLFPAGPYMACYYATKAYVVSLSKAIAEELREEGSNVYVGALCPGPVDTEFNDVANVDFSLPGISSKKCVAYAYKMMKKKNTVIVPTLTLKLAVLFARILPESMILWLVAGQQKRKKGL